MKGTITWFAISKNEPPVRIGDDIPRSDNIIVTGPKGWIQQTYYIHPVKAFFAHNELPFEITHWAFINQPET